MIYSRFCRLRLFHGGRRRFSDERMTIWDEITEYLQNMNQPTIQDNFVLYGSYIDEDGVKVAADIKRSFPNLWFFDDSDYGGQSNLTLESIIEDETEGPFMRLKGKLERIAIDDPRHPNNSNSDNELIPWSSRRLAKPTNRCFCAIKCTFKRRKDLQVYDGIQIVMRNRSPIKFSINMYRKTPMVGDLFQLPCDLDDSPDWQTYHIPFLAFHHVQNGQPTYSGLKNTYLQTEGFGFLFHGEAPKGQSWRKDFELDIKEISILNELDNQKVNDHLPAMKRKQT